MTTSVRSILRDKGAGAITAPADLPVRDALRMMVQHNVGSLLVLEEGRLVGLFAERDLVRAVAAEGDAPLGAPVASVMVSDVLYVSPDTTCDECMALMTEHRARHLPVLGDDEELVGIVSIGDVVKRLIDDKGFIIEQLERYIAGR